MTDLEGTIETHKSCNTVTDGEKKGNTTNTCTQTQNRKLKTELRCSDSAIRS